MVVYDRLRADQAEELADSQRTALHWIEDDAAWQIIEVRRQEVRQPVEFLSQAARVDPRREQTAAAAALCLVAFEAGVLEPRAAQAKAGISDALAQLPPVRCAAALCQLGILRHVLQSLAANLSDAGVPIDPDFDPDLLLLAQLCMLDSRASLQPESLIYAGPNTFSPDGRGLRSRSSNVKARPPERVGRLRRAVLEATPTYRDIRPTPKESGRAGGSKKGSADARREALACLMESHSLLGSNRSAAKVIWASWGKRGAGLAMQQMTGETYPPSVSTLAKDLSRVRNTAR
jgi:hypothetical protein